MSGDELKCPNCGTAIKLTESLAKPLIEATRRDFEKRLAQKDAESAVREEEVKAREAAIARRNAAIQTEVDALALAAKADIAAEAEKRAKALFADDLAARDRDKAGLEERLKDREQKLTAAQDAQADLLRKQRELDDAKRELELSIEKKVEAALQAVRERAKTEAQEAFGLTVKEKDAELTAMRDKLTSKDAEAMHREEAIKQKEAAIAAKAADLEAEAAAKVEAARAGIAAEEKKRADALFRDDLEAKARELQGANERLQDREVKLAAAQAVQADLMRKQRELDDEKRELALTVEKKVEETLVAVREKAKVEAENVLGLKMKEKEEQLASMQRKIEELSRKAEQGSQQLQGEVLEMEIETRLRSHFPHDTFEPVPKGRHGGDILHHVKAPGGQPCGTILWETKRTKTWSANWLTKLRDDQRAAKADVALIATIALPSGVQTFDQQDGVWIASFHCIIPVAVALRHSLIEVGREKRRIAGQNSKMELVYEYLTGNEFRQRVAAIVERFEAMRLDLAKERAFMERQWSAREKLINGVVTATSGMYGDLQGIAGSELPEIESLNTPLLDAGPAKLDASHRR